MVRSASGGEQVAKLLFIGVAEVKIKVGNQCLPGVAQSHDILYDRGTESVMSVSEGRNEWKGEPEDTFPRTGYRNRGRSEVVA